MESDPSLSLSFFKVEVYRSLDKELLTRVPPPIEDAHLLESLFLEISREIAKHNHWRLLSPLFFLITPTLHQPSQFASAQGRSKYIQANTKALDALALELRRKLANSPLTILIVETTKPRWAAFSPIPGCENTIIIEKRFLDILKVGGPDSRLLGFMVGYHEFAHLIRRWFLCRGTTTEVTPKKILAPCFNPSKKDSTRGEAGSFAEWACFGGVAGWDNGLFLRVKEGFVCHVSPKGAQAWWDTRSYPHLLQFLTTRASIGEVGDSTIENDPSVLHTSPPTCFSTLCSPLGSPSSSPIPMSVSTSPTQATSLGSYQSLLPGLNMSSRSPKTPKNRTNRSLMTASTSLGSRSLLPGRNMPSRSPKTSKDRTSRSLMTASTSLGSRSLLPRLNMSSRSPKTPRNRKSPRPMPASSSRTQPTSLPRQSLVPVLNVSSSSSSQNTPRTRYKPYRSPTSASVNPMLDRPRAALAPDTYLERQERNLYTVQKEYGEEDYEWLNRVVEKSAVEDRYFRHCHFDFERMGCEAEPGDLKY